MLQALCDSAENCIRALLGGPCAELSEEVKQNKPHEEAVKCIEKAAEIQGKCEREYILGVITMNPAAVVFCNYDFSVSWSRV